MKLQTQKHGQQITRKSTLVDEYIRQLGELGISLESLGLLGDFKFPEEDKDLTEKELIEKILQDDNYKEQKKVIEKYITEFIKADLMTQEIHRRRGTMLTNVLDGNDDWVDGGVYLFRTSDAGFQADANEYVATLNGDSYIQMQYVTPEEFEELKNSQSDKIRYRYTINEDTGEIQIAQVCIVQTKVTNESNAINSLFTTEDTQVTVQDIVSIDYKSYISKYTMPYEFLVNLCEVTQNPEFVYHVAQLARGTEIMLVVHDNTVVEHSIIETEEKYETYESESSNLTSNAKLTKEEVKKIKTETITTNTAPVLKVEYANTWSFYEDYEYTKTQKQEMASTNGTVSEQYELPEELPGYQPGGQQNVESAFGGYETITTLEKWSGTFLREKNVTTNTTTTITSYSDGVLKNSVEKSKQFLGLLRNSTGDCNYTCDRIELQALSCAYYAEFVRDGIDVKYGIPNSTREEEPLGNLRSGEKVLYNLMGEGLEGDASKDSEEDYKSQYKSKMTGLVDHMKYLMTFPENEQIVIEDGQIKPGEGDTDGGDIPGGDEDTEDGDEGGDSIQASTNMVQAAEEVHRYLRVNGYKYKQVGITVPSYRSQKTIDCSSYVTWVILNAGYRSSNFKENMYQWSSKTYNKNPEGWQTISNISQAQAGDILCYNGHVEIYAGSNKGSKPVVYNCGGSKSISFAESGTSGHTINQITKILRVPI